MTFTINGVRYHVTTDQHLKLLIESTPETLANVLAQLPSTVLKQDAA